MVSAPGCRSASAGPQATGVAVESLQKAKSFSPSCEAAPRARAPAQLTRSCGSLHDSATGARRRARARWLVFESAGVQPGAFPQLTRHSGGLDAKPLPPCRFIADAMHLPVMDTAERDSKFVACLAGFQRRVRGHYKKVILVQTASREDERGSAIDPII